MTRESRSDGESGAGHSNRRRFLKCVGAATAGAVGVTGTASAQQYRFEGCDRVCGDTDADIAVVATDDGFDCRPMTEAVDPEDVPWDWAGYCYEATAEEAIVGAIEEDAWQGRQLFSRWTCQLETNPNDCADEHYESADAVKAALNENENCGACAGTIVSGDGEGITTTNATATSDGAATGDETGGTRTTGSGTDDDNDADDGTGDPSADDGGSDDEEFDGVTSIAGALRSYVDTQFGV